MSVEEFLVWSARRPIIPLAIFLLIPVVAWIVGVTHDRTRAAESPWKYVYSTLVYLSCVPGVLAAVIVAYTFLFTRESLLKLDLVVTFLPIISMITTLVLIARRVDLDRLPGFDRLWGLITLLTLSFVVAMILDRLRIWLFFGGGMVSLLVIAAVLYLLLRSASRAVVRGRR